MDHLFGGFGSAGFGFGGNGTGTFSEYYRCYSVAMAPGKERETLNHGSGVILPPSALAKLTQYNVTTPYKFALTNEQTQKTTHASVLEFIAEEGRIYLPRWMMATLGAGEGSLLQVKSATLPRGKFVKIQPQSVAFLDISDPKAVLERAFRSYLAMTLGDKLSFVYADREYQIEVLELKPSHAVSLIDTDLEVDFAPPVGYVEPSLQRPGSAGSGLGGSHASVRDEILQHVVVEKRGWDLLSSGQRLNGKSATAVSGNQKRARGTGSLVNADEIRPSLDGETPLPLRLPLGQLFFGFNVPSATGGAAGGEGDDGEPKFKGEGNMLKSKKGKGRMNK
ncbi:ubiquitin fusion degradation protein [Blastocladiella emersonii ATCC 22665]|nr:ubiquitin fusion degradation protein [Blastocladiella emersonii ATCC 22665]